MPDDHSQPPKSAWTSMETDGPAADSDYLTYANIRHLIEQHLEERSLMLDVHTRYLLSQLRETASAQADRKRAEIEASLLSPHPAREDEE